MNVFQRLTTVAAICTALTLGAPFLANAAFTCSGVATVDGGYKINSCRNYSGGGVELRSQSQPKTGMPSGTQLSINLVRNDGVVRTSYTVAYPNTIPTGQYTNGSTAYTSGTYRNETWGRYGSTNGNKVVSTYVTKP